jgi:hypothetical protein
MGLAALAAGFLTTALPAAAALAAWAVSTFAAVV